MNDYPKPDSLDRKSGYKWREVIQALQEQDTFRESDLDLVERYVVALQTARLARESTSELFTYGSKEQTIIHPAVQLARSAEADAQKYGEALLLTPAARAKAKVGVSDEAPSLDALLS